MEFPGRNNASETYSSRRLALTSLDGGHEEKAGEPWSPVYFLERLTGVEMKERNISMLWWEAKQ